MAEYIEREAFKQKYLCCGYLPEMSEKEFDEFPTADVVPVTRCKDCKYVRNLGFSFGGLRHDSYFCVYNGPVSTGGDDFCSHGELQTNGGGNNNVSD